MRANSETRERITLAPIMTIDSPSDPGAGSVSRDQKTEARLQTSRVGSSSILGSPLAVPWPLILRTHCLLETLLYHVSRNRKHNGESETVKPKSHISDSTNTPVSIESVPKGGICTRADKK